MEFIRKYSKLWFVLVMPVYFYIVQSSIQNKHTHFYPNGMVVTHSHPVDQSNGDPINHHHHSKTEICFFSNLHFDFYDLTQALEVNVSQNEVSRDYFVANERFSTSFFHLDSVPRAPPVC